MTPDKDVVAEVRDLDATEYRVPLERLAPVSDGTTLLWRVVAHTPQGLAVSSDLFAVRLRQEKPTPRALPADERAIRDLTGTYQHLTATRDMARLRAIQPGVTSVELEALQRETRVLDSQSGLSIDFQSVRVDGRTAMASFSLRYTVLIEGQRQVRTTNEVMRFEKTASGSWIVVGTTPDTPLSSPVESDEAAIRRLVAAYERLLKNKDLTMLNIIRPNPTAAELAELKREIERDARLQDIAMEVESLRIVEGRIATAQIRRQDTLVIKGKRQVETYGRILVFEKTPTGSWVLAR